MKGIYIVDADMDFVHYLERLILRNLPNCKTLGHNFKGNDFLNKIKENPDLLKNIDLLIVNPKLNDMTGLALVEKTKSYRKDINVCITLKDNIKQFFINDLSEKGLEHVIIYPNNDEYFLDKFKEIFESIDAEKNNLKMRQSAIHNNVSSESQIANSSNVEDVFSFLNSNDFLNQFDIDGLSDDFFLNKENTNNKNNEEPSNTIKAETKIPEFNDEFNQSKDLAFSNNLNSTNQDFNFSYEEPTMPTNDFNFGYEEPKVPNNNSNFGYQEPTVPINDFNFGYEEPTAPSNDFNFGYEEPKAPKAPNNINFGYEEPSYPNFNEPKNPIEEFNFGYKEPTLREKGTSRNTNEFNYNPIGSENQNRENLNQNSPKDRFGFTESPIYNSPAEPKKQNSGLDMGVFGVDVNNTNSNIPKEKPLIHSGFENNGAGFNKGQGFNPNPQPSNPINNLEKPKQGYYDYPSLDKEPNREYDLYDDSKPMVSRENQIKGLLNTDKANNLSFNSQIGIENQQEKYTHEKGQYFNEIPTFAKQIVHFFSTKGGIGKTTACVNAAIQLAKYSKKRICVVDFDLTNANLHTHFGMLDARYDLTAISNLASEIDGHSLSRIITPYRVKDRDNVGVELDIIVGFREMVMRKRFDVEETDKILSILEEMYDIVIVDSHPVYTDESVSTILKKATKIIFITEQDLTALGGTRDFILAASKYQIPLEKIYLVLNRYKSNTSTFTKKRLESTLGKNIMAVLPFDIDSSREAVNTNMPITLSKPDSELAKSYFDVAKIIDPTLEMPEEKKTFFSFLGKK